MLAEPWLLLALASTALLAAFVEGLSGFGFGLVSMALLPMVLPIEQAVPMVGAWSLSLNLVNAWSRRAQVRAGRVLPLVLAALPGIPLGLLFLTRAPEALVQAVLGLVILGYIALSRRRRRDPGPRPPSTGLAILAGLFGGALGGAFNTSGPPVVLYLSSRGWTKEETVGSMQVYFAVASTLAFLGFLSFGLYTAEVRERLVPAFPAAWLGLWLGTRLNARVSPLAFTRLVLGLLGVMGLVFLVRGGRALLAVAYQSTH